jgi:hypothetical protein
MSVVDLAKGPAVKGIFSKIHYGKGIFSKIHYERVGSGARRRLSMLEVQERLSAITDQSPLCHAGHVGFGR